MCFADLFETDLRDGQEKIVKSTFDFSYRSFSFQKSAKDRQSIQDQPQIAIKISLLLFQQQHLVTLRVYHIYI